MVPQRRAGGEGGDVVDETVVEIRREEDIVVARQAGRDLAKQMGYGLVDQSRIPTAISELARNILRYAGTGKVTVRSLSVPRPGIEVVAEDQGPGIANIKQAMTEGYSSSGGLGMGLPGTKRLMDEMEIDTAPGRGTIIVIRKWRR